MKRLVLCLVFVLTLGALGIARAEIVQHGHFRVAVDASLAPKRLPRDGQAGVRFHIAARFIAKKGETPPQLRQIRIEINRHGRLDPTGLPLCRIEEIQPAKTSAALQACAHSLIGEGHFAAKVQFTQQSPFPSNGKLLAFNGRWHGHPAILAHVYGPKPVPTSYTIPFAISTGGKGTYGTTLSAALPRFSGKWGYVTGISMTLGRRFSSQGGPRDYITAACPAPKGLPIVSFRLSRASFSFAGHQRVSSSLTRTCTPRH